jgi:hypothetical protein
MLTRNATPQRPSFFASCPRQAGRQQFRSEENIGAFEIDPDAAARAVSVVRTTLDELGVPSSSAAFLARSWIRTDDFLEASLAFPVADFVIGNPPYIRLEEIPESKAASYRAGFSAMRGRADIYVAFYQGRPSVHHRYPARH